MLRALTLLPIAACVDVAKTRLPNTFLHPTAQQPKYSGSDLVQPRAIPAADFLILFGARAQNGRCDEGVWTNIEDQSRHCFPSTCQSDSRSKASLVVGDWLLPPNQQTFPKPAPPLQSETRAMCAADDKSDPVQSIAFQADRSLRLVPKRRSSRGCCSLPARGR